VKGQPEEELALGLGVVGPDLMWGESRVAAVEPRVICGASVVASVGGRSSSDGSGTSIVDATVS
jgi:hypothetical protein